MAVKAHKEVAKRPALAAVPVDDVVRVGELLRGDPVNGTVDAEDGVVEEVLLARNRDSGERVGYAVLRHHRLVLLGVEPLLLLLVELRRERVHVHEERHGVRPLSAGRRPPRPGPGHAHHDAERRLRPVRRHAQYARDALAAERREGDVVVVEARRAALLGARRHARVQRDLALEASDLAIPVFVEVRRPRRGGADLLGVARDAPLAMHRPLRRPGGHVRRAAPEAGAVRGHRHLERRLARIGELLFARLPVAPVVDHDLDDARRRDIRVRSDGDDELRRIADVVAGRRAVRRGHERRLCGGCRRQRRRQNGSLQVLHVPIPPCLSQ